MKTTAKQRRKAILALIIVWVGPGGLATFLFRNSLSWVQFQSYIAIVLALAAWFGAETPVEKEASTELEKE